MRWEHARGGAGLVLDGRPPRPARGHPRTPALGQAAPRRGQLGRQHVDDTMLISGLAVDVDARPAMRSRRSSARCGPRTIEVAHGEVDDRTGGQIAGLPWEDCAHRYL